MFKCIVCHAHVWLCMHAHVGVDVRGRARDETQRLWELQEAHLNSLTLPDWENMERLLGTDAERLFLDFPPSRAPPPFPEKWEKAGIDQ